jgi:ABC-type microcin C transport system permease subunit YejB
MADDYTKIPREVLARANEISERTIFWGMVFTVLLVVAGMTRGIFG